MLSPYTFSPGNVLKRHAARPHIAVDTILVASQMINNIQSIVARNVDPLESAVVSITMIVGMSRPRAAPQARATVQRRTQRSHA